MADDKRTDAQREKALQQQQEDFARANQGLPPKHAPESSPKPEALPITESQAEENTAQERKAADKRAAQENTAARRTGVEAPNVGVQGTQSRKK